MILQHNIIKSYKKEFTLYLNPKYINEYVGSNIVKYANSSNQGLKAVSKFFMSFDGKLNRFSPFKIFSFSIPDIHYAKPVPITSLSKYQKIHNLFIHKDDYTKSKWYQNFYNEFLSTGKVSHKKIIITSDKELHNFFKNYALGLIESMLKDGYNHNINQDIGNIMIGPNGEIHKSNAGDHRFFTAKIVGVKLMPFRVKGIHRSFLKKHNIPNSNRGISKLIEVVRNLEEINQ